MIARFIQWRNARAKARNERIIREVRAQFAAAGGKAAARKRREPVRQMGRLLREQMGLPDDPRLA